MSNRDLQEWLIKKIAGLLETDPDRIDIHEPFSHLGLSSRHAVELSGELETLLGKRFPPTLAYEYPSISSLAHFLAQETNVEAAALPAHTGKSNDEPIAIIGMSCRFPGADDPDAFWKILSEGVDCISEIPPDRWSKEAFYDPDPLVPGKSVSKWGGLLKNVDLFDPFFFGISPNEARQMDPQQRLLLELSYEALDHAGQDIEQLNGSFTGVYMGISVNEYSTVQFADPASITGHSGTGSALSISANRISYFFNFHGPSMAIDTACSASLAAVHLACKGLREGECDLALAGGVNIILSPAHSISFTKAGLLAKDGRCKSFDAAADGYVRGEGGGIVVLKPLSKAIADGDPVLAVIKGSAMVQDGRTNGLAAPNREAQEILLRQAYNVAGISPSEVQYVEAHGTGTLLGDSMEAAALGTVVGKDRKDQPCIIGSVKTNIGHLEAAAGVAGLIKVVLAMKHRMIPPSLHFHVPNPHIPFEDYHLKVQQTAESWPAHKGPALAAMSSFGFGGTLVHTVIEEAPLASQTPPEISIAAGHTYLLPLSANSSGSLKRFARSMLEMVEDNFDQSLKDICMAVAKRRSRFRHRMAVMGHNRHELAAGLRAFLKDEPFGEVLPENHVPERLPGMVFVFSGQGGQWMGMGRGLMALEPAFKETISQIDDLIQRLFGWSLMDTLMGTDAPEALEEIDRVQPAIFAIQTALAELWRSKGIVPDAVVGHSMGEVAAALVAGILSLEDAVRIVCIRSSLLKNIRGKGAMLATDLSEEESKEIINGHEADVSAAVFNGPTSTVLAGSPELLTQIQQKLEADNRFCRWVKVDVASHSPQIEPLRKEMMEALLDVKPMTARIPFYSTVTGAKGDGIVFDNAYWVDNIRKPVLFYSAIKQILESDHQVFIEAGPHPVLIGSVQQTADEKKLSLHLLPSMRNDEPEANVFFHTLGKLYTQGFQIGWNALYPGRARYVNLPLLEWERQRYWMESSKSHATDAWKITEAKTGKEHPLLGKKLDLANQTSASIWEQSWHIEQLNFLKDHLVGGQVMVPGAAYLEMCFQLMLVSGLEGSHVLSDVVFLYPLLLQAEKAVMVQTVLTNDSKGKYSIEFFSKHDAGESWKRNAYGSLVEKVTQEKSLQTSAHLPEIFLNPEALTLDPENFYGSMEKRGILYGPAFRGVQQLWRLEQDVLGSIELPEMLAHQTDPYRMHPALMDACLQVVAGLSAPEKDHELYLPAGCHSIQLYSRPGQQLYCKVSPLPETSKERLEADIRIYDKQGKLIAELLGFRLRRAQTHKTKSTAHQDTWLYQLHWKKQSTHSFVPKQNGTKRHWLVFADSEGVAAALVNELEKSGDSFEVLPAEVCKGKKQEEVQQLVEAFAGSPTMQVYGIIHLWSLSIPSQSWGTEDDHEALGCNSVLYLVQTLAKRFTASARLWLVTCGAQAMKEGETVAVEQSPMWGLGKAISFELPELKCVRLDLDPGASTAYQGNSLFQQLHYDDTEDQVAIRGEDRFVLRIIPYAPMVAAVGEMVLRPDRTYLITGGLGALGLVTAARMVYRGARYLVLTGRRDAGKNAQAAITHMRQQGATVVAYKVDVSAYAEMKTLFETLEREMPPLAGVVHAAGVLDDASLLNLNAGRMKTVMAPKVSGTWNLHKLTARNPLDFFVLYSSAVSVLGSPGQGNYAAASAYLDAMAQYRRSLGLPAISINWGPWADIGLAAEALGLMDKQAAATQHLIKVIDVEKGLDILEQLILDAPVGAAVLPFNLKHLLELYPAAAGMTFFEEAGGNETHVARLYARPNLQQPYVAPRTEIERKMAELWQQTLHIERVGIHDSFFELGGDSVLAAQILSLARKNYGLSIPTQEAFKAFTIERLAELLEAEIIKAIDAMSEEEAENRMAENN